MFQGEGGRGEEEKDRTVFVSHASRIDPFAFSYSRKIFVRASLLLSPLLPSSTICFTSGRVECAKISRSFSFAKVFKVSFHRDQRSNSFLPSFLVPSSSTVFVRDVEEPREGRFKFTITINTLKDSGRVPRRDATRRDRDGMGRDRVKSEKRGFSSRKRYPSIGIIL